MHRIPLASALALSLALLGPLALAQPSNAIDVLVTLSPTGAPAIDAPAGLMRLVNATPGERYEFELTLSRSYTTFEIQAHDFDLTRAHQLVPSLRLPETEYPLFHEFPNAEIWDVDAPARVYFVNGTADDVVLRLGLDGPANVTLLLDREVTPPTFTLGAIQNITHYSFYQETNTNELAKADLQVRAKGASEWVVNPTPSLHFRQRFPIQGLQPDTEYEARLVFTDWAGNNITSETYTVRSAPLPYAPLPTVTPLSPTPNATLPAGTITVRARIDSNESPVKSEGVRLFFDKREVSADAVFDGHEVLYTPQALTAGSHSVAVEAMNDAGGKGVARWTFEVEGPKGSPLPVHVLVLAFALALVLRRGRG